jgi:AraC-like DNA-binding protein
MFNMPLKIVRGDRTVCSPKWRWYNAAGQNDCFNLWFIAAGEGTLQTSQALYDLHPGDCFLLRLWDINIGTNRSIPLVVSWVCFNCLDVRGRFLPPEKCPAPREHRRIPDISFFDPLLQRVIDNHAEGPAHAADAVQWLRAALLEIAHHDRRSQLSGLELEHDTMVETLCATIRERPEKITSMKMLAAQAHCSVDHLIRVFKRHKRVTPWEFVIRCRIEKASNLLRFSSHSVSQAADLLGYADIYSFSKQFKAHTGRTPTQYRK